MIVTLSALIASISACAAAGPVVLPRTVTALDEASFEEAQQADDTAVKAFSNAQIQTSDGRCLFVDELSGDFRANLTPIQVAGCGTTNGQGWDVITSGKHNNAANSILVVSTLTEACFNFDPRRAAGNQVLLFSCGGRADGGGLVTNSQLFTFNGSSGPITFTPENQPGSCLTVKGGILDIADCVADDTDQMFNFSGQAAVGVSTSAATTKDTGTSTTASVSASAAASVVTSTTITGATTSIVADTATFTPLNVATTSQKASCGSSEATTAAAVGIPNPTDAAPVSRAGGTLQPTAVTEAQQRDGTATRAFTSVSIRAPNGQCLFIDPTAGDFRENLIPVSLVSCGGTPNEKFDVITSGVHNNARNYALIVSSLTQGCVSFDGRRAVGDTVTLFSCGGRADGSGQTNSGQLIPFTGGSSLVFAPESDNNATCIIAGNGRLDSAPCANDGSQLFTIQP